MALSPQLLLSCGIWTSKKQNKGKVESLRQHRPYLKLLWIGNLVVYSNLVICTSWTWGFFWFNLVLYFHIKGCNKTVWIIWVPWFSTTVHECQVSLQTEHTGYMEEFIWVKVKLFSPILKNHFSNFILKFIIKAKAVTLQEKYSAVREVRIWPFLATGYFKNVSQAFTLWNTRSWLQSSSCKEQLL